MTEIELQSEYIFSIWGFFITNSFFTSVLTSLFLIAVGLVFYSVQSRENRFTSLWKVLIFELLSLIDQVTKNRKLSERILPLIATFFIFIVTANLLGLLPGFLGSIYLETGKGKFPILRSPNSDLTTTVALAIISVISIQIFSIQSLGIKGYLMKFINFRTPLHFILGIFQMISESIKIISFSFRLFGNIFAGEVLILVIVFLIPFLIPLPFMVLEVFVGFIQAFIFAMLTLTFIKTSIIEHLE